MALATATDHFSSAIGEAIDGVPPINVGSWPTWAIGFRDFTIIEAVPALCEAHKGRQVDNSIFRVHRFVVGHKASQEPEDLKRMHTIIESEEFEFAKTLLGEPEKADRLLENCFEEIALAPESFPVVRVPDLRMACFRSGGTSAAVFFIVGFGEVELLWLAVGEATQQNAA